MSSVLPRELDVLRTSDVRAAAELHHRSFQSFFLTSLGKPFLREFYAGFVDDPDAVTAVTRNRDGQLVGVAVGTMTPNLFFRRLLRRRGLRLALACTPAVMTRPAAAARVVRGVVYRGDVPVEASGALLSSICVDPLAEHRGHGRQLIDGWWRRARQRGATSAYLTTDADDNQRVNAFYQRSGWSLRGSWTNERGRRMHCYAISAGQPEDEVIRPVADT